MKKVLLWGMFFLWGLSFTACTGEEKRVSPDSPFMQTVHYVAVDDLFPNPERGFYRYTISTEAVEIYFRTGPNTLKNMLYHVRKLSKYISEPTRIH